MLIVQEMVPSYSTLILEIGLTLKHLTSIYLPQFNKALKHKTFI